MSSGKGGRTLDFPVEAALGRVNGEVGHLTACIMRGMAGNLPERREVCCSKVMDNGANSPGTALALCDSDGGGG